MEDLAMVQRPNKQNHQDQHKHQDQDQDRWGKSLFARLTADLGAATISATLVAPAVTIIDR